ncbi:MAG: ATP-binding protein [Negativicutes bacterium]|nr:ATP-binding protein [Negativicutes bacterium]
MKIAISGSHGVGKTTLAKALSEKLNYPMITEVARTVAKEMGFANTDQIRQADMETITRFQTRIFYDQMLAEHGYREHLDNFISDRSIFDCVAYMILYGMDQKIIDFFIASAAVMSGHYDLIIFCPVPLGKIQNDGFRLTDKESQFKYGMILKDLLITKASCPVAYLHPSREKWLDSVLQLKIVKGDTA